MNAVLRALAEDAVLRYAVNLALGAASVSAMGLLLSIAARKSAALRQGFLTAAILVLAALPLLIVPEWRGGLIRTGSAAGKPADYGAENSASSMPSAKTAASLQQNVLEENKISPLLQPVAGKAHMAVSGTASVFLIDKFLWGGLLVWVVGSLWGALRAARGLIALRRVRAESVDAGGAWAFQAKQAAEAVGLVQVPRVAFAVGATVPFSLGGRQPLVLLPESAREIEAAEAEAIMLHEIGHIVHRHHLIGMVMTAVEILYGWIPLVRPANAALAEAMEEICDNHVLLVQGNGRALARCLVNAAEAAANGLRVLPGSAILHGRRGLNRRLAKVLERDGNRETRMNRIGRAATVAVALMCMSVCEMVRVIPAEAEEGPDAWARYFPMTVGSEWMYRTTYAGRQKPGEHRLTVRGRLPLQKGGACVEIETNSDGLRGKYLYAGLRADGYYAYQNAPSGMQGVDQAAFPAPLALFPLKAGRSWTWQEASRGETNAEGAEVPDAAAGNTECKATLEKTDAEVTVVAGKYRALRIRIQRKNRHAGDSEEVVWYAKNVGAVRREIWMAGQKTPTSVAELTRFLPGTRQAEVPEEVLPLVRKLTAGQTPLRDLRALPLWNGRFLNHFAVAKGKNDVPFFYRTADAKVVAFNPMIAADWNRLLEEEAAEKPLLGPTGGISTAQEIGLLMAEALMIGTDAKTGIDQVKTKENSDGSMEMRFTVRGFTPQWSSLLLYLWVEYTHQGEITALKFATFDPADQGGAPAVGKSPL